MMINSIKKLLIPLALCLSFNAAAYKEKDLKRVHKSQEQIKKNKENNKQVAPKDYDCSKLDLSNSDFTGADLAGFNLSNTNLSGANLTGAALWSTNLTGANLTGANLTGANLGMAYLRGANLSGANLTGANLKGANLQDANLSGANFPQPIEGQRGKKNNDLLAGNYEEVVFENKQLLPITKVGKDTSATKIRELLTTLGAKIAK